MTCVIIIGPLGGTGITKDDKLAETKTGPDGAFELFGVSNENLKITAKFNLYHQCGMTVPVCYYKLSYTVPSTHIFSGSKAKTFYNAGTIELAHQKQERDCLN
ncbi:unnamed protein product, partial [Mesorhabditis spiculigera]